MEFLPNSLSISLSLSFTYISGDNPRIIEHPMDMTVPKNDPFTFNCKAEGDPTPSIQWFKDGHELKTDTGSHRLMLPAGGLFFLKVSKLIISTITCITLCIYNIDTLRGR